MRSLCIVGMLLCLSGLALAGEQTDPVTVTNVGPQGGTINSITVDPQNSSTVYAATRIGVFKSTDNGTTWSGVGPSGLSISQIIIDPLNPSILYGAKGQVLLKSLDAGATWNQIGGVTPFLNSSLLAIDPNIEGTLYLTGGRPLPYAEILKSIDGGMTWQSASQGVPNDTLIASLAIDPHNTNTVYAAGFRTKLASTNVAIFKTTNGGASWTAVVVAGLDDGGIHGLTIDPINSNNLYLATAKDAFKSTNGGRNWSKINNGLSICCFGPITIDPQDPSTIYTRKLDGLIFKSINGGQSWSALNFHTNFLTIDPKNSNVLYAGTFSGAFKSTDGGLTWNGTNWGLRAMPVRTMAMDPQSPDILYSGTDFYGVVKSTDKGMSWLPANSGLTLKYPAGSITALAIDPQNPSTVFAGTGESIGGDGCNIGDGGVFKTVDAGMNWMDTGMRSCITELAMDPQKPDTLYAVTDFDGVFKTTDGGISWNQMNSGLQYVVPLSLALDSQNPQTLYTSVSYGSRSAVEKSVDGGMSWNPTALDLDRNTITSITMDAQNSSIIYAVAGYTGRLWKSVDGGESWQDLSSSLPVRITVLAVNPKSSAIYAGTNNGVLMSSDGGESWSTEAWNMGAIQFLLPKDQYTLYAGGDGGIFEISTRPDWTVTSVSFDSSLVRVGTSFNAIFNGPNLTDSLYFDVEVRTPDGAEIVINNWQLGRSVSHDAPVATAIGAWTIDAVRAHQDPNDHTGSFVPVSATTTVSP